MLIFNIFTPPFNMHVINTHIQIDMFIHILEE
nr:MAG TPA: hypothetical protein [Caudoviricetes sp.]DAZ42152.1 MAG TPA: hypothetical protein [Caudoviricetes sp.]